MQPTAANRMSVSEQRCPPADTVSREPAAAPTRFLVFPTLRSCVPPGSAAPHARGEGKRPSHLKQSAMFQFAQQRNVFQPAEALPDPLPLALTDAVTACWVLRASMALGPGPPGFAPRGRHVHVAIVVIKRPRAPATTYARRRQRCGTVQQDLSEARPSSK